MFRLLLIGLLLGACRTDINDKGGSVDITINQNETDDSGPVLDTSEPEPDTPLNGTWSDCSGTIKLSEQDFLWESRVSECRIEGTTTFIDSTLTVTVEASFECESFPWWLNLFDDGPSIFSTTVVGSRLALFALTPTPTIRIAQFEEHLDIERWKLTSNSGSESMFKLCSVDGAFFDGRYQNTDGNCDFLSCSGRIDATSVTETGEHWTTICQGSCPCGAIVTLEHRTDTEISGQFHGSNCGRNMEGTFTGVRETD